jgi:hypothetical protein
MIDCFAGCAAERLHAGGQCGVPDHTVADVRSNGAGAGVMSQNSADVFDT